jgi:hypothetical protein
MSKKVLAIYYSQSGQLRDIINNLSAPLLASGNSVETVSVKLKNEFPFPWTSEKFFALMPDCVLENPAELEPVHLKETAYDLIILGYQAWFLSPGTPSTAILQYPAIQAVLKNTPVVTVTGCRNMWLSALESIKNKLKELDAKQVGNIAAIDKNLNVLSFFTIQYWMYTGKKDRMLNIFPKPGVSDNDIKNCSTFGEIIAPYLHQGNYEGMQKQLVEKKAVVVSYNLMNIESKAKRIFFGWANFIAKRKKRSGWLVAFKYYLIIAFFVIGPIIFIINNVFFRPFSAKRIKEKLNYYSGVNQ